MTSPGADFGALIQSERDQYISAHELREELVSSGKNPAEFLNDRLPQMRLENFFQKNFADKKGFTSSVTWQKFLEKIRRHFTSPEDEGEKIDAYNHLIEIIVQQAVGAELARAKANDFVVLLTGADEDFSHGGTDLELKYQGVRLKQFSILVDVTLARVAKIAAKGEAQKWRNVDSILIVYSPVSKMSLNFMEREDWYNECAKIMDGIKTTGRLNLSWLGSEHSSANITQTLLNAIELSLRNLINERDTRHDQAQEELEAIHNLKELLAGAALDQN